MLHDTSFILFATDHLHDLAKLRRAGDVVCRQLVGSYNGAQEVSWLAALENNEAGTIMGEGLLIGQESILMATWLPQTHQMLAGLHYLGDDGRLSGNSEDLGELIQTSWAECKGQLAWTYDPSTDTYWITTK